MGCPCILQSGSRQGESCGRPALDSQRFGLFCRYHYKQSIQRRMAGAILSESSEQADNDNFKSKNRSVDGIVVECVVCLGATKLSDLVACVPCGHTCICCECAQTISASSTCPICDTEHTNFVSLYFSGVEIESDGEEERDQEEQDQEDQKESDKDDEYTETAHLLTNNSRARPFSAAWSGRLRRAIRKVTRGAMKWLTECK